MNQNLAQFGLLNLNVIPAEPHPLSTADIDYQFQPMAQMHSMSQTQLSELSQSNQSIFDSSQPQLQHFDDRRFDTSNLKKTNNQFHTFNNLSGSNNFISNTFSHSQPQLQLHSYSNPNVNVGPSVLNAISTYVSSSHPNSVSNISIGNVNSSIHNNIITNNSNINNIANIGNISNISNNSNVSNISNSRSSSGSSNANAHTNLNTNANTNTNTNTNTQTHSNSTNSHKTSNKGNGMISKEGNEVGVTTHYYWRSGAFTTTKNDNCQYIKEMNIRDVNWFPNPMMTPCMRVIEPISMQNINILSYYNDLKAPKINNIHSQNKKNGKKNKNKNKKIMPAFKDYIFFSKKCTFALERMIDSSNSLIDSNRLYQFESRYFQYALLQGKVTFVQTFQNQGEISNNGHGSSNSAPNVFLNGNLANLGGFGPNGMNGINGINGGSGNRNYINNQNGSNLERKKEYLIFRFGHRSKLADKGALFGVCQRNRSIDEKHPNYQPWQCIEIATESSILKVFGLQNASEGSKIDFLGYLPKPLDCHTQNFNSNLEFDINFNKISKILLKGSNKYHKDKKYQEIQHTQRTQQEEHKKQLEQMEQQHIQQHQLQVQHPQPQVQVLQQHSFSPLPALQTLTQTQTQGQIQTQTQQQLQQHVQQRVPQAPIFGNGMSLSPQTSPLVQGVIAPLNNINVNNLLLPNSIPTLSTTISNSSNASYNGYGSDNSVSSLASDVSIGSHGSHGSLRSIRSARSGRSGRSFTSNKSITSMNSNASGKLKNEDKYKFLNAICLQMKINFEDLILKMKNSIENAFKFAKKYPKTVLTQAYIDEERKQVFYEPVLLAEIKDDISNRVFKFVVPIVESKNKKGTNGLPMYVAKNILTPQMAIENIMLNTSNVACYDPKSWVARMWDYQSFYEAVEIENQRKSKKSPRSLNNFHMNMNRNVSLNMRRFGPATNEVSDDTAETEVDIDSKSDVDADADADGETEQNGKLKGSVTTPDDENDDNSEDEAGDEMDDPFDENGNKSYPISKFMKHANSRKSVEIN